jgi:hypothetical protein
MRVRLALLVVVVLLGAAAAAIASRDVITVPDVAAAALREADAPPPRALAPGILDLRVEGLAVPDLRSFGLRATGRRVDRVVDREVTTVAYRGRGRTVTYSIVSGDGDGDLDGSDDVDDGVPTQERTREDRFGKVSVVFTAGGSYVTGADPVPPPRRLVARVERAGRTAVLTSTDVGRRGARELLQLAAFRADGRLVP